MSETNFVDELWLELAGAAALGSGRRAFTVPAVDGKLGELLSGLQTGLDSEQAASERRLLLSAAVVGLYRKAGCPSLPAPAPGFAPCEAETAPLCSPAAGRRLASILEGQYSELVGEWLELAGWAGLRPPAQLLPALLDLGGNKANLEEPILAVIGERGRWLAAMPARQGTKADWSFALDLDPQQVWQTGTSAGRRRAFKQLRRQDPAAARALLASSWAEEPADERSFFVAQMKAGLSPEDEPFLEKALNDRSREVRLAATDLLGSLPASRFVDRMTQRALRYLSYEAGRGWIRKARLVVSPPEAVDEELLRDGVERRSSTSMGERALCLVQVLSSVPPAVFTGRWNVSADELLDLAAGTDWKDALHSGWLTSTTRFRDAAWAAALLAHDCWRSDLFELLSPGERSTFLLKELARRPGDERVWQTILSYVHENPALAQKALSYLIHNAAAINQQVHPWTGILRHLGYDLNPDSYPQVSEWLSKSTEHGAVWKNAVQDLLSVLDFRYKMHKELISK